jgi:tetratricopeptide (TPR) repeat protein
VLEITPRHPVALIRRGALLDAQGKQDAAIQDFSAVIDGDIDRNDLNWRSSAFNGRAVAKLHAGKPREALQDVEEALKLRPSDTVSLFNRAVVHEALNDPEAAIRDYSEAVKRGIEGQKSGYRLTPDFTEALFNRGLLYQKLGMNELATEDFKSILSLDVDAKTKQAAASRLEALGRTVVSPETRTYRVQLYHADENDKSTFDYVAEALTNDKFVVERVAKVSQEPNSAVVRYFFKEDAAAASNVRRVAENALARQGYNTRLQTVYVPLGSAADDRRGELHVRVPSLKLRALPTDVYRQAPMKK